MAFQNLHIVKLVQIKSLDTARIIAIFGPAAPPAMRLDSAMPTKVMAFGIGFPFIQVEMVLAGGKAERFPGGGQHHHAIAPA